MGKNKLEKDAELYSRRASNNLQNFYNRVIGKLSGSSEETKKIRKELLTFYQESQDKIMELRKYLSEPEFKNYKNQKD